MQHLITKAQRDNFLQIMRNNIQDPDAYDAIAEIESLPVLEDEPVAYQILERDNYDLIDANEMPHWEDYIHEKNAVVTPLYKESARTSVFIDREAVLGAVARGWCALVNGHKIMDSDLALAIGDEIVKLLRTHPTPFTPITADDVPKQLVRDLWIVGEITSLTNGAETIATFVNAYMGAKK